MNVVHVKEGQLVLVLVLYCVDYAVKYKYHLQHDSVL